MNKTGWIVVTTLLIVMLAVAADAQTPVPVPATPPVAARPIDRSDLRHQIYVMEGALVRAVSFGAQRLTREIRSVVPEMMAFSGEPQARGVYLDGYGVYFDVGVPILHQSAIWSFRTMLGQDDKIVANYLPILKQQAKEARTPAAREALEYLIGRFELQQGFNAAVPTSQAALGRANDRGLGAMVASEAAPSPAPVGQPLPPSLDPKFLQDPNAINRAYTESVQRALVDAMLDYALPMAIAADEFLTVGARDNMQRDSLAPPDPFEELVTILLRIKGSDLAAYRAGQIDREEARKRVQIREF